MKSRISVNAIIALLILGLLTLNSCSTTSSKQSGGVAQPEVLKVYQKGLNTYKNKKTNEAAEHFKKVWDMDSSSSIALNSKFYLGEIAFARGEMSRALQEYREACGSDTEFEKFAECRLRTSQLLLRSKLHEENLKISSHFIAGEPVEGDTQIPVQILRNRLESARVLGNGSETLRTLIALQHTSQKPSEKSDFRREIFTWIESVDDTAVLSSIADSSQYGFARAHAYLKLGKLALLRNDISEARSYLSDASKYDQEGIVSPQSERLLSQIALRDQVNPKVVGAILPLSGKFAKQGQRTLQALQLALGIYGRSASSLELVVIDSEGTAEASRRAIDRMMKEDKLIALVGGLVSKSAELLAQKAQEFGVPTFLISQKSGMTKGRDFVFTNSITTEMQVRHLVRTATQDLKLKRFAILYPNDSYGIEFTNLFWDEVLAQGGEVRGALAYNPNDTDFRSTIQRLVGTYVVDDRLQEYRARLNDWEKSTAGKIRKRVPKDILQPVVDFEAIFIPDRLKAMGQLASMLVSNDVTDKVLLGTNIWNSSELSDRLANLPLSPIFVDTFPPDEDFIGQSGFGKEYFDLFGLKPEFNELQAYEIGITLRKSLEGGQSTRIGLRQALSELQTYQGGITSLSMTRTREVLRPVVAITVESGKMKLVDPNNLTIKK